jgi:hypothetical protein
VFAIQTNGDLLHTWAPQTGAWVGWDLVGSGFTGSPAASTDPSNGIRDVYAIESSGDLVHNWAQATGPWAGWDLVGSGLGGTPVATAHPTSGIREIYLDAQERYQG